MTTPEAAAQYLRQHQAEWAGRPVAIYNPDDADPASLPVIYGFINSVSAPGWFSAASIAEDGTVLGGHVCSAEGYAPHDLGVIEGSRPDRHTEQYQRHYPKGYRMEWVPSSEIEAHEGLQKAIGLCNAASAPQSD